MKDKLPLSAKLGAVGVGMMRVIVFYFMWLMFSPFNPADVKVPIDIKNHTVTEGEPVTLILDSCVFVEVPVKVEVQLVGTRDEKEFILPLLTISGSSTTKGCVSGQPSPIPLNKSQFPLAILSGVYKIRLHTTYTVNSIRTEVKDYDSQDFEYIATTPLIPKE